MKNHLVESWNEGRSTLNGWIAIPSSATAEVMARAGWDSLTIDMQHGLADYQAALGVLTAISTTPTVPLARVPWLDEGIVMRMLDAGCLGIICPMVNSVDEAARFASACRYAPRGSRSYGPVRAATVYGADYWKQANDQVVSLAMIETAEALDQLDAILGVEELSGVYIGPSDLALSLGVAPRFDPDEPKVVEAITHIIKTATAAGKRVGMHTMTPEYAKRMADLGADLVTVGSDLRMLKATAEATVEQWRGLQ
ncbi:HpcH/HpaI aldolase family protein [Stratiformator vulcanicus]|uniref:4-hydroxy-2-oxo-heptane-1,7-dioate aldolase n=1 Tax=Stratiformator vulcanicus TaxID=2527980 RepID=A0A517QX23_9PLAN|nr:aldolase/citrate lyase family protein [Stratiformator vulcanicus]QDT36209.1 4-hydroxy-2-oxo-heptane-1,7-dioate aldolase [Stratiformator vulcanicus]